MALDSESKKWLTGRFGAGVKFDEPMSRHTSLRVGGPAEAYVAPPNMDGLQSLINWAWQKGLPYLIVGDGTNLLVKDGGIGGIVIVLTECLKEITKTGEGNKAVIVTAMAGARLQALCRFAIENGLAGMNFALGIPGTVGGGIMMNAGTAYGWIENVLRSIRLLLPDGQLRELTRNRLNFSYRKLSWSLEPSQMYPAQPIVVEGSFGLHPSDPDKLKAEAEEILKTRRQKQPVGVPSAGCFFKNPASGKTAGELIELAGLKGKSIGAAEVSSKHANFLINTGQASAADFLALMELVQETVSKMFNIDLEREVKIVGT
ncbi:MAG: UDP-N-acetylmuramate dehydrogenase [Pseudomonadota bacterium]|uniref:UDP-N-acetylenolpyruvoylglucosamine reductase n=1 Tax=Candidatus Desulfatibia profunda TaxID=2841695 RepID=A0A8J6NR39_9BACT|nr:UDP-N-acetylmuramate dehydrogenase [Candidatus Desulfatibia profunda]MBL7178715.1 UDP-N-acetylmuramate dehydrogenase [Desulfobacterales bacterium]